jgi:hypothetical protein
VYLSTDDCSKLIAEIRGWCEVVDMAWDKFQQAQDNNWKLLQMSQLSFLATRMLRDSVSAGRSLPYICT